MLDIKKRHNENFLPLILFLEKFSKDSGLKLSHSCDGDPLGTFSCYFFNWPLKGGKIQPIFIRICVTEPLKECTSYFIDAEGFRFSHQRWNFSLEEGEERLRMLLQKAKKILDEQLLIHN